MYKLMKKILFLLALLPAIACAQGVKISNMPTLTTIADIEAGYIPIVYNGINYKFNPDDWVKETTTITINGETFDLSQNRSWTVTASGVAWGDITGPLADQTDLITALNAKVDESLTITINGVTQDLSANRSWTVATYTFSNALTESAGAVTWEGNLTKNTTINGTASGFYTRFTDSRLQEDLGASIASANSLTLGNDGNTFTITGTTQINAITTANWQAGSVVRLIFSSTPTVKHNTAGGGGTAVIQLSGATDFVAAANDVLTLVYDGTDWHETSRKLTAGSGSSVSSTNGITTTGSQVKLGGAMTEATTFSAMSNTNTVTWTGAYTGAGQQFLITNTSSGSAFGVTNNGGSATVVFQNNGNGTTANITANSGTAITAQTTSGTQVLRLQSSPSSTSTTVTQFTTQRLSSGTAANNIAGAWLADVEASDGSTYQATKFVFRWDDATAASRTSSLLIEGTENAVNQSIVQMTGAGNLILLMTGQGYGLKSPDGTIWYITVSNAGALSTSTTAP